MGRPRENVTHQGTRLSFLGLQLAKLRKESETSALIKGRQGECRPAILKGDKLLEAGSPQISQTGKIDGAGKDCKNDVFCFVMYVIVLDLGL